MVVSGGLCIHALPDADAPPMGPKLVKLFAPVYPPLAKAAHVWGDVSLLVALESAEKSFISVQWL